MKQRLRLRRICAILRHDAGGEVPLRYDALRMPVKYAGTGGEYEVVDGAIGWEYSFGCLQGSPRCDGSHYAVGGAEHERLAIGGAYSRFGVEECTIEVEGNELDHWGRVFSCEGFVGTYLHGGVEGVEDALEQYSLGGAVRISECGSYAHGCELHGTVEGNGKAITLQ